VETINITLARKAVRLFNYELAPRSVNRHNRRQWLRSVTLLGPRWRALPSVQRVPAEQVAQ
jgi:hypothetical protein